MEEENMTSAGLSEWLKSYLGIDLAPPLRKSSDTGKFMRVFGGAVRDFIAGEERPSDVDILMEDSLVTAMCGYLERNGYFPYDLMTKGDTRLYDRRLIKDPLTYMNKDFAIVQIIVPVFAHFLDTDRKYEYFLGSVDLTCCGVSWDGRSIYENYPGAVGHCRQKVYGELWQNVMYSNVSVDTRKNKLAKRGWRNIKYMYDDELHQIERDMKLDELLDLIDFVEEIHPSLPEIMDPDELPF